MEKEGMKFEYGRFVSDYVYLCAREERERECKWCV